MYLIGNSYKINMILKIVFKERKNKNETDESGTYVNERNAWGRAWR